MAPFSLLHLTACPVNKQAQAPARARHLSLPILLAWSCPSECNHWETRGLGFRLVHVGTPPLNAAASRGGTAGENSRNQDATWGANHKQLRGGRSRIPIAVRVEPTTPQFFPFSCSGFISGVFDPWGSSLHRSSRFTNLKNEFGFQLSKKQLRNSCNFFY